MITENEQKVYDVLKKLDIEYVRFEHKPIYTVEESQGLGMSIEGQKCKNLFLRDNKGARHFLVVIDDYKRVDLKGLSTKIESTSLSFASESRLLKYLSLTPGCVGPFGLINDISKSVEVIIDKELDTTGKISFHPNVNTATISIDYRDFEKFLTSCGNKIRHIYV